MNQEKQYIDAIQSQDRYMQLLSKQLEESQIKSLAIQNSAQQTATYTQQKDNNLVEYQLNCERILDKIYHTLSGDIIEKDLNGNEGWVKPKDDRLIIFSEYGVRHIMAILSFYINPHQLLSCYNVEQVTYKILDFGTKFADLIYFRYEFMFYYPSPEELYSKYHPIMLREDFPITNQELYDKCLQWSREELQNRIKHYPILIESVVSLVHAIFLRALDGEERDSLRKYMHITHNANIDPQGAGQVQPTKFNLAKPSTW